MFSNPSRCLGIFLLLVALLSIAAHPSKAGQSPTAPIPTYIFGRADFPVGKTPVALASGDFNGDGQPDMVVVNQIDNSVSILLGKPDGTFAPHVDYPTGPIPTAVAVADFNRDGNLDIAVANQNCTIQEINRQGVQVCGTGSVSIFLGNGDGTFGAPTELLGGVQPVSIAVADFNGDGNLDLAVANATFCETQGPFLSPCVAGTVSVFLGDGTGGFPSEAEYATPKGAFSLVVADFNGDHKVDIGVTGGAFSGGGGVASVLLGNGDGTFQAHIDSALGASNGLALAVADFNGDGKPDLVAAGNGFVDIMIGNGDGTFIFKQHYFGNDALAVGDFNGDGKIDLAVSSVTNAFAKYSLAVMLGNGDGTFQSAVQYSTGINPQALLAVDLNGDGKTDLAAACDPDSLFGLPGAMSVVLGFGDGTFAGSVPLGTGTDGFAITSADLNGDGKQDIATTKSLFLGNGDGTFQTPVSLGNYVPDLSANFVAAADFNGDGKTDLAVVNLLCPTGIPCNPGSVSIFLGTGDFSNGSPGPYQPRVDYPVGVMPNMLTIGDFNGDNKIDLAVANGMGFPGSVSVLPGKGDGTFLSQIQFSAGGPNWVASGDLNGDGKLDLAIATSGSVMIALGNGDGTFQQATSLAASTVNGVGTVVIADLNHDGKLDLAVTRALPLSVQGVVTVFLGNGDGTFQTPVDYPSNSLATAVVQAADINGDGKLDLLIGSYGSVPYPFSILIGNGDGTFRLPVSYFVPSGGAMPFTLADFNQDGVLDVAAISGDQNVGVMLSAPFTSVSPAALNFVGQGVGTTSPAQKIAVSNGTNVPFSIAGAVASGNFTATNNCGATLQPGANCIVSVKLSPGATGAQTGHLTITDSTRTSPTIVPLTGTAINGPFLSAFPARWTFPAQAIGVPSSPLALQLVNTGNAALSLNSIGISGANGPDFHQTNTCGGSLAAGANCTVNITFTPAAGGYRAANLAVSVMTGTSQAIPLFGSGSDFNISSTPFSPATVAAGVSATSTIAITSLGGFSGSVNLSCTSGTAAGVSCSFNPANVTVSSNGTVSSTLTVNTTESALPASYTLTVTGTSGSSSHATSQVLTVQAAGSAAFSLAPTSSGSSTASVSAGQNASYALSATSAGGFSGTINLTCSVSPAPSFAPTCKVPATVQIVAGTPGSFSVTVATTAKSSAQLRIPNVPNNLWAALICSGLLVLVFALVPLEAGARKRRLGYVLATALLTAIALVGCGGGSNGSNATGGSATGTPSGNYTIKVVGTSGSVSQTTTLNLTVQ